MLKYLRIAVTALSLTACVLLIALWVRSYFWRDELGWLFAGNQRLALLQSHPGQLIASLNPADGDTFSVEHYSRIYNTKRIKEPQELTLSSLVTKFKISYFSTQYVEIDLPYWFLVIVIASLGSVPWIKWPKRFTLRTLLIATTLVAVGMGLIVMAM